ncbi:MFS transporter [Desulfitobacterium hafniense]|uniref:MFS transporter n=1 Tax=Desulfitobacterium hafniense TaxID=49338 RepID=UPI0012FBF3B0|nr:MFS transporter [Desulfitobacterium hafniense]
MYILVVGQFLIRLGMTGVKPYFGLFLPEIGVTTPEAIAFWAGLVGSVNFLSMALLAPVWGNAADQYGKKMMVIRCATAIGVINLLTAAVGNVYQLVFLRFTLGVFAGYNAAALALIASGAPKEKMGYAVGLLQTGQMAGTVFGPAVGGVLSQFGSYRMGFVVAGIMGLIVVPVIIRLVKEPAIDSVGSGLAAKEQGRRVNSGLKVFRASPFLLLLLFLIIVAQYSSQGMDTLMALFVDEIYSGEYLDLVVAVIFALTGLSTVIIGPVLGRFGDRHGHFKIIVVSLFGMGVLTALQSLVVNEYQLGVLRFAMGLFTGGLMPNLNALIANHTPADKRGIFFGVTSSANSIGNFLGPFTSGMIASLWGIRSALIATAVLLLICAVAATYFQKDGGFRHD